MLKLLSLRLLLSAVAVGGIMSAGAYGTFSAWTDTSSINASTLTAGTVDIADDTAGSALFTLAGLLPGASLTKCINVTNAGTADFASVELTGTGTGVLSSVLNVTVDRGAGAAGGTGGSCTGFTASTTGIIDGVLNAVMPTASSPVTETTGWAAGASKSYRIKVRLDPSALSSMQGKTAALGLTWTAST
jgi:predicted ribosomally synthesized peptide with SipW-like signal peptide